MPGILESLDKIANKPNNNASGEQFKQYCIIMGVGIFAFLVISPSQTARNFELLFFLSPLWMTLIVVRFGIARFVQAKRAEFIAKQKNILLELRFPQDTNKSLKAMETFFSNINFGPGESNWYKQYWSGGTRPWWSFEIVSLGGRIHFYIWTREQFRRGIESALYAQYADMEVIEAEDYSRLIDPASEGYELFGDEFKKSQPDPWPIRTYVEYELDKAGAKPEEQVDPLSQIVEFLGSMSPKEQFWIQIIIRQHKGEKYHKLNAKGKPFTWADEGKELIEGIRTSTTKKTKFTDPTTGKVTESEGFPNPSKGQIEGMAAIENNIYKAAFDTGIRIIYSAPKEDYKPGATIAFLTSIFKPFSSEGGQGLSLAALYSARFQDFPWEDKDKKRHREVERNIVDYYRRRVFFNEPYIGPYSVLSTEELATLYHIPSGSVSSPALPRIPSATNAAPANLPT
jgi:hypothetical protein